MKKIVFEHNQQRDELMRMTPEESARLLKAHMETPPKGNTPIPKFNAPDNTPSFPDNVMEEEGSTPLLTFSEAEGRALLQKLINPLNEEEQDVPLIQPPDTYTTDNQT